MMRGALRVVIRDDEGRNRGDAIGGTQSGGRDRGDAIGMVFGRPAGWPAVWKGVPISFRSRSDLARTSLSACSSSTNEP